MIRLTFIVGGGKSTRSKYDEGALPAVLNGLKGCGYREDKGAGCVLESGGSYKVQHDTGKNVKTVVVFPRIVVSNSEEKNDESEQIEDSELIPRGSIGYKIAISPMATFANLVMQHCPTYLQKKRCMRTLSGLLTIEATIENKLMVGQQLDQSEQIFYHLSTDLKDKMLHVQKEAARHIDEGNLTGEERKILLETNEKKVQTLLKEKNSAKVAEQLKKALARKEMLNSITNEAPLPPLRLENQINTLRKKLAPLKALEEASNQRYLSIAETSALSEMDDLEREIDRLEQACCGWFEEEEVFALRVQASRDRFENMISARAAKKGGGKGANRSMGGSAVNSGSTKWILPGGEGVKSKKNAWGVGSTKKKSAKGGAVFSAMMLDSSSEEESDDDNEPIVAVRRSSIPRYVTEQSSNFLPDVKSVGSASKSTVTSTVTSASMKSFANACGKISMPPPGIDDAAEVEGSKKTKKKKKAKKKKANNDGESSTALGVGDGAADETNADNTLSTGADKSTVSQSLAVFASALFQLLWTILLALISMLSGLFAKGKAATKEQKKKAA